jgi:hypothetical protein
MLHSDTETTFHKEIENILVTKCFANLPKAKNDLVRARTGREEKHKTKKQDKSLPF